MLLAAAPVAFLLLLVAAAIAIFALTSTGGGPSCPQTEAEAQALGAKIKPDLDAWGAANPFPVGDDREAQRAWFKAFVTKAFSLMGACGSERSDFARDFRRGFVLAWVSVLIAAGQIDEEVADVVAWFQAHPTYDPLDGMPWDTEPGGSLPPAPEGQQAGAPSPSTVLGIALATHTS